MTDNKYMSTLPESTTPLTDEATFKILSSLQSGTEDVVKADFARSLERYAVSLQDALKAFKTAVNLPQSGTSEWEAPGRTYNSSYGGGDCSKHGRYYGICHSCDADRERAQEYANAQAGFARDNALRDAERLADTALKNKP